MRRHHCIVPLLLVATLVATTATAQITPAEAVAAMGRGLNLGNTLEPPFESAWNNGPAQEHYFDDYVAAGFESVRIPVRWDEHTLDVAPFTIDPVWMDRVEAIVDWALARDLEVIINAHHEDWLKQDYGNQQLRDRFDAIWTQVAARFKDKSERLFMEIINEPFGMTKEEVDDLNARILAIIRADNPTRIVIYSGWEYSGPAQLRGAAIPDDPFVVGYYHSYDPWQFAGLAERAWGTEVDRSTLSNSFQTVKDWSLANDVPVVLSEFGAIRDTGYNDRMAYYAAYVEECVKHGFAFQVWDDGGMFRVYRRDERTWNDEKDILINTYPDSPTRFTATVVGDTAVTLAWENRLIGGSAITVQRRLEGADWVDIDEIPASATVYSDPGAEGGHTYEYRVIARHGLQVDRWGYPQRVVAPNTVRSSYHGAPFSVPGVIEAEDFDVGGEGLTYHDVDATNTAGAYRSSVAVDIAARLDGGYQVTDIVSGEWLEYTLDVQPGGLYSVTTHIASVSGGGRFRYSAAGEQTSILAPPATGSVETTAPVTGTMTLAAGAQILRLELLTAASPFAVDRFELELLSATSREAEGPSTGFAVYPNPAGRFLEVLVPVPEPHGGPLWIEVYNVAGQRVLRRFTRSTFNRIDLDGLAPGWYLARLAGTAKPVKPKRFVRL